MRTNLLFFSALFWLKVGIIAQGTLLLKANLSFAQNVYPGRRLPPPPAVRQPTKRSDSPSAVNCSQCSPLNLPPVNSPSVRPPVAAPVSGNQPLREYVFQAPATVRPADATVINNHPRPTVNPPAPRPENRANKPPHHSSGLLRLINSFALKLGVIVQQRWQKFKKLNPSHLSAREKMLFKRGYFSNNTKQRKEYKS